MGKTPPRAAAKRIQKDKTQSCWPLTSDNSFYVRKDTSCIEDPHASINITMWAACCLGYFAFLQAVQFTLQSAKDYDPAKHLSPLDIAVDSHSQPTLMRIHLKHSKTDQQWLGVDLYVGCTFNNLCPVAAMLACLALQGQTEGPFFMVESKPLSREFLVQWLRETLTKAGIDSSHFSGHSFRIGAASTASAKGISEATIWADGTVILTNFTFESQGRT